MFKNREEAGKLLGEKLKMAGIRPDLVLAIPRGGVVVGRVLADLFQCPLDLLVVKKIGSPFNPELAIGAVAGLTTKDGFYEEVYWEEEICRLAGVEEKYKIKELKTKDEELKIREKLLRFGKISLEWKGKTIILTDDGVATGATVLASIRLLRKLNPKKIILAVPVIAQDTLEKVKNQVDTVVCLEAPIDFYAVGQFYEEFEQVSDGEVQEILSVY